MVPVCETSKYVEVGGNALDGFRVKLIDPAEDRAPAGPSSPCRERFRKPFRLKRATGGAWFLYREDLGRLDREVHRPGTGGGAPPSAAGRGSEDP